MVEHPRIAQLQRRVQRDPASVSFAALAEEYRRAGRYEEAIATCRIGLRRHPAYLSPRVTLGRALLATGQCDDARKELQHVLRAAPGDPAASRALAELRELDSGRQPAEIAGAAVNAPAEPAAAALRAPHPALAALESFLAAILRARASLGGGPPSPPGR